MTFKDLPVWRSMLFVPVTAQRFVDGAAKRGADAIILDLEDAVAASEKERARTLVPEAAQIVSRGGADVVVRLNRPMRMTVRDLEAVIGPGVHAVALPKAESAAARPARRRDHRRIGGRARHAGRHHQDAGDGRDLLGVFPHQRDRQGAARGWSRSISGPRISPLSAGMLPEAEGLFMPKQMCVFAARAAGIMPMGFVGTVAEFHDLDGFRADGAALAPARLCRRQRHPSEPGRDPQRGVPAQPPPRWTMPRRVVAAYDKALAEGVGAVTVDGKMIDVPVVERAKLLLAARGGDRRSRGEEAGRRLSSSPKSGVKSMSNEHLLDPNPGSPEAVARGCTCPPQAGPEFVYDQNCPVHATADRVEPSPHGLIDPDSPQS